MNFITAILGLLIIVFAFKKGMLWGIIATILIIAYAMYLLLPRWYAIQIQKAFNSGDYDKAKAYYKKANKRLTFEQKASYAYMLIQMGEPEEAVEILNFYIKLRALDSKNRAIAKRQRCFAYYKMARYEEALKDAKDVYEDGFMTKNLYGLMGMIMLVINKDLDETTKFCEEAYEYDEDDRDIQDNMSICYYLKGDYEMASEINSYVRDENEKFVEGYYHGAQIAIKQNKYKDAKEMISKISECNRTQNTTVSEAAVTILKNEIDDLLSGKIKQSFETDVFTLPEPVDPPKDFYIDNDDDNEGESIYDEYKDLNDGEEKESIYDEYNKLNDEEKSESIYDEYNKLQENDLSDSKDKTEE